MSQKTLSADELIENSTNYDFEDEELFINVLELVKLNEQLESGKLALAVDLEGDDFVDVESNPCIEYELTSISGAILETTTCVVVSFEGVDNCGLPVNHNLRIGYFEPKN